MIIWSLDIEQDIELISWPPERNLAGTDPTKTGTARHGLVTASSLSHAMPHDSERVARCLVCATEHEFRMSKGAAAWSFPCRLTVLLTRSWSVGRAGTRSFGRNGTRSGAVGGSTFVCGVRRRIRPESSFGVSWLEVP